MIEQISTAAANPPFCYAVLPRTSEARPLEPDAKALCGFDHFVVELWATIKDQIAGRRAYSRCSLRLSL